MDLCIRKIEQNYGDSENESRIEKNRGKETDWQTDILTYRRTYAVKRDQRKHGDL